MEEIAKRRGFHVENRIKELVLSLGADVCGIANTDRFKEAPNGFHPKDIFPTCKSVIVFGIALPKGVTSVHPRLIYGHSNNNSIHEVDMVALKAAKEIEKCYGGYAIPMPSDGPYEDWDEEKLVGRGLISMRHAAVLAGVGTLGKSSLLINEKYGTMLTLGMVLIDFTLVSDEFAKKICLDGCNLCIKNCPAHALDGDGTDQAKCRTHTYGRNTRGFETVDCNQCRVICPMKFGMDL